MKKYNWIDDSIILDFDIPNTLKNTIKEIEQADMDQDKIEYNILSDTIDVLCKTYCTNRIMTKEQWDLIMEKYFQVL